MCSRDRDREDEKGCASALTYVGGDFLVESLSRTILAFCLRSSFPHHTPKAVSNFTPPCLRCLASQAPPRCTFNIDPNASNGTFTIKCVVTAQTIFYLFCVNNLSTYNISKNYELKSLLTGT